MIEAVAGVDSGKGTLIYVHGRQCKPAATEYFDLTLAAIAAGLERDHPQQIDAFHRLNRRIAYYGDLSTAFLTGKGEYYDEQLDLGDRRNALQQLRAIGRRKKFGLSAYDSLPGKSAMAELAADIAGPVLGSMGLSKTLISSFARDLDEYWNDDSDYAARVQERVRAALCEELDRDGELLLISHGTGSIVTYDVLWQLSHDERYSDYCRCKVDTWMTLGAPLGDTMVRRRLQGAKEKGRRRYPTNIVAWNNISAEDDWLCHDNTLADDYKPMLRQKQVSAIRDHRIYNLAVRYGKSDPHCSLGYLIHPRVSSLIADWLSRPLPAPELGSL